MRTVLALIDAASLNSRVSAIGWPLAGWWGQCLHAGFAVLIGYTMAIIMIVSIQASEGGSALARCVPQRSWTALLLAAACGAGLFILGGCASSSTPTAKDSEPKQLVHVASIRASVPGNGEGELKHLIQPPSGPNEVIFWETGAPFPHTFTLDLDPSEAQSVQTYAFVTGNHGENGADSILRMPRGWTLSGSDDGTNWVVLDKEKISTPWKPNEERRFHLSSPARQKHFRLEMTESGPQPILRIYGIRLYAN